VDVLLMVVVDYVCLVLQDWYDENHLIFKLQHVNAKLVQDQPHVVDADIINVDIIVEDADKPLPQWVVTRNDDNN